MERTVQAWVRLILSSGVTVGSGRQAGKESEALIPNVFRE